MPAVCLLWSCRRCMHVCRGRDNTAVFWEHLLKPAAASSNTHFLPNWSLDLAMILTRVLLDWGMRIRLWGRRIIYWSASFGQVLWSEATPLKHAGNITRGDKHKENVSFQLVDTSAGGFAAESKVAGQCDTGPYMQPSKAGGAMFGSTFKSPPFMPVGSGINNNLSRPWLYAAFKDRRPAAVLCCVVYPEFSWYRTKLRIWCHRQRCINPCGFWKIVSFMNKCCITRVTL